MLPLFAGAALVGIEYLNRLNSKQIYQDIVITASLFVLMYLSLRFDHCLITDKEFSRTSYFLRKHTIPISEISEITFPPTWEARLNHNEHTLKDAIDNKRVRWHEYRVPTPVTHSDTATKSAL